MSLGRLCVWELLGGVVVFVFSKFKSLVQKNGPCGNRTRDGAARAYTARPHRAHGPLRQCRVDTIHVRTLPDFLGVFWRANVVRFEFTFVRKCTKKKMAFETTHARNAKTATCSIHLLSCGGTAASRLSSPCAPSRGRHCTTLCTAASGQSPPATTDAPARPMTPASSDTTSSMRT